MTWSCFPCPQDERVALLSITLEDLRGRGKDIAARLRKQAGAPLLLPPQQSTLCRKCTCGNPLCLCKP